jgi:uncharacterized repeat protein (TIGR02543 family)
MSLYRFRVFWGLFLLTFTFLNFSLAQSPVINSFTPNIGSPGTLVTITGTDLDNAKELIIGGVPALIVSNTSNNLVGVVMPGALNGPVSVSTAAGLSSGSTNFTVLSTPYPGIQQGNKLFGTSTIGNSEFGSSVAVSADGNTAIVGGPSDNGGIGAAWIFVKSGNSWVQQGEKLIGNDFVGASKQGCSVGISADGNTVIVGGSADREGAFSQRGLGAAWIYKRIGNVWIQDGDKLVGNDSENSSYQGWSVGLSADGNTAIVGGPMDNINSDGAAWIYKKIGNSWIQQGGKLFGTDAQFSSQGWSVGLSADGNTAIVGGYSDNNFTGAAWIFVKSGNSWIQQGTKLVGTGFEGEFTSQGWSVGISADGNTAIIGGFNDNNGLGAAWIFKRSENSWSQEGKKIQSNDATGISLQGSSVSISADGNSAIIGGRADNNQLGAFWFFTRSQNGWIQRHSKNLGTGSLGNASQGYSVSLSSDGSTAIIGGNTDNNNLGSAWIFSIGVKYDGNFNNDGLVPDQTSAAFGSKVILSGNSGGLVKTGYTFEGWNTNKDGSGSGYKEGDEIVVDNTIILYAQWKPICQKPEQPTIECYQTATWNEVECKWEITGTRALAPIISVNGSLEICPGSTVTLVSSYSNGNQWYKNGEAILINGTNRELIVNQQGNYSVKYIQAGCESESSLESIVSLKQLFETSVLISSSAINNSVCKDADLTFTASPTNGGLNPTYQWFVNGNLISGAVNETFTTKILLNNTQVKVVMTSNLSQCLSGSPATSNVIEIKTNLLPLTPIGNSSVRCGIGSVELKVNNVGGTTVDWYDVKSGGSILPGGNNTQIFKTPVLFESKTYFAQRRDLSSGCVSNERREIVAKVITAPNVTSASRCGPGSVKLVATSSFQGTIEWYSSKTSTKILSSGSVFTTPRITKTTTYFVAFRSKETNCVTDRISVDAVINQIPSAPSAISGALKICPNALTEYTFSTVKVPSVTYNWKVPECSVEKTIPKSNSNTIKLNFLGIKTTDSIKVQAISNAGCLSATSSIRVTTANNCKKCVIELQQNTSSSEISKDVFLNQLEDVLSVKIFPNPANDYFNLSVMSSDLSGINIRVIDLSGKVLQSFQLYEKRQLSFGKDLRSGIYFVEVRQKEKSQILRAIKL